LPDAKGRGGNEQQREKHLQIMDPASHTRQKEGEKQKISENVEFNQTG